MNLPLGPIAILGFVFFLLAWALAMILSRDMRTAITEPVRSPPGVRWIDLYASADPVPNGPTRVAHDSQVESSVITNRRSLLLDHTSYWENLDGFVLRVVRACLETAGSPWNVESTEGSIIDERAVWRIQILGLARWIHGAAWLIIIAAAWTWYGSTIPLVFEVPQWLPATTSVAGRMAVLLGFAAAGIWLTSALLFWPWHWRVRKEQEMVLGGTEPSGTPWLPLVAMATGIELLVLLALRLASQELSSFRALEDTFFEAVGLGGMGALVVRWLLPPPGKPKPPQSAPQSASG